VGEGKPLLGRKAWKPVWDAGVHIGERHNVEKPVLLNAPDPWSNGHQKPFSPMSGPKAYGWPVMGKV